jgi:hypothetical protein
MRQHCIIGVVVFVGIVVLGVSLVGYMTRTTEREVHVTSVTSSYVLLGSFDVTTDDGKTFKILSAKEFETDPRDWVGKKLKCQITGLEQIISCQDQ